MKKVAVFASESRSNALHKESLIYDSIDSALKTMPDVAWERRDLSGLADSPSRPGLSEVRSHEKIVALGRAAHTVLADYCKQTLVAGSDAELLEEDVERLVWSCVNTLKIVALGRAAWRSIQLLPVSERRYYDLPPLRMAARQAKGHPIEDVGKEVLVINHESDDFHAKQVAEALARDGYQVQRTGRDGDDDGDLDNGAWSADAAIHVHVGCHDSNVQEMRLLDTWHSRRYAIVYLPRRLAQCPPANTLMVQPEVNGFVCDTPDKVLAACSDIRTDPVLRKKMLHAGAAAAMPLARAWTDIAADLIA